MNNVISPKEALDKGISVTSLKHCRTWHLQEIRRLGNNPVHRSSVRRHSQTAYALEQTIKGMES